jgi:hypothetical protein
LESRQFVRTKTNGKAREMAIRMGKEHQLVTTELAEIYAKLQKLNEKHSFMG